MKGLLAPDVVLIGEGSKEAGDILQTLYEQSTENSPRVSRMSTASAEIMKLSLNCFVTTKIAFANSARLLASACAVPPHAHPPAPPHAAAGA